MIPQTLHRIWLNPPLSQQAISWGEGFSHLNTDWKNILWTKENIPVEKFYNKDIYWQIDNTGHRADIARLELLYLYGGVYADCDVEFLKPLNYLGDISCFFSGLKSDPITQDIRIETALMGSTPGHPFLRYVLEEFSIWYGNHKEAPIPTRTGPHFVDEMLWRYSGEHRREFLDKQVIIFPELFLFHPRFERSSNVREVPCEAHAIHHCTGSWK